MLSEYENLLLYSARVGNLEDIRWLLSIKINIDVCNEWNGTPLYLACQHGQYEVAEYLLEAGADLFIKTDSERTPLDIAYTIENDDIVNLLLDYGAGTYITNTYSDPECILYDTPGGEKTWFKRSPYLLIRDVLQPGRFTILRRIRARIKYLFS